MSKHILPNRDLTLGFHRHGYIYSFFFLKSPCFITPNPLQLSWEFCIAMNAGSVMKNNPWKNKGRQYLTFLSCSVQKKTIIWRVRLVRSPDKNEEVRELTLSADSCWSDFSRRILLSTARRAQTESGAAWRWRLVLEPGGPCSFKNFMLT